MAGDDTTLEGSDRDLGALLVKHSILQAGQLLLAIQDFEARKGTPREKNLASLLIERGDIDPASLNALREKSRMSASCFRCDQLYHITFYVPTSVHHCTKCGSELEPLPAPEASIIAPLDAGSTMLDMGTPAKKPEPAPQTDPSLVLPPGGDQTMLDMGAPARKPGTPPAADPTILLPPGGGQTVLDMGRSGKEGTPPGASAPTVKLPPAAKFKLPTPPPKGAGTTSPSLGASAAVSRSAQGGRSSPVPASNMIPAEVEEARKEPKRVLGKYVIVKEIGRGGQAIVYKCWDSSLAQFVALKIVRLEEAEEGAADTEADEIKHFQREAQMAARLRHPNIVRIYELGSTDGKHYLSMELIEGKTLYEFIHGGKARNTTTHFPKDPEKFLKILRDVARAVHYAHSQQPPVIHRDLKPQNVLVTPEGIPCVADFGLAKEAADVGRTETVSGVVKGTPAYMAPEQAEGHSKDTDHRTDVYSLGAVLFEILTGRPPFVGESVRQVLNQICTKLPDRPNEIISKKWHEEQLLLSPSTSGTGTMKSSSILVSHMGTGSWFKTRKKKGPPIVARQLETICLKALEKRRADRYQSAKDFANDIDRFLQHLEIEAREPGLVRKAMRKMRAHPIITGVAAAILFTAGIAAVAWDVARQNEMKSINRIVDLANEHLETKQWARLQSDVASLADLDPDNSNLDDFRSALENHRKEVELLRTRWDEALKRLKTESIPLVLEGLREPFRTAGEDQSQLKQRLERAILETQTACIENARTLLGSGPDPRWLEASVRQGAQTERDRLGALIALANDPDFATESDPSLPSWRDRLDQLLAYEGTWTLRVNVSPYAEVVLTRDDNEVKREFTPLGLMELEVGKGYSVDIYWPSREQARQSTAHQFNGLRHGSVVVITGDITKAEIQVAD